LDLSSGGYVIDFVDLEDLTVGTVLLAFSGEGGDHLSLCVGFMARH
jgi:hypothetical protein